MIYPSVYDTANGDTELRQTGDADRLLIDREPVPTSSPSSYTTDDPAPALAPSYDDQAPSSGGCTSCADQSAIPPTTPTTDSGVLPLAGLMEDPVAGPGCPVCPWLIFGGVALVLFLIWRSRSNG